MKYEVNECCDCATDTYPCIGDECSQLHKTYYQCDECGEDELTEDEIHHVDDMDFCERCYENYQDELESYDQCCECGGYGDDYSFHDDGEFVFPDFDSGKMYVGMEIDKKYKLDELRITYKDGENNENSFR